MKTKRDNYIFPLSFPSLTPLYDLSSRWLARDLIFKNRLVQQARLEKGHRILDIGCGTATLTIMIKKNCPEAEVTGLDGDADVLKKARFKTDKADVQIKFDQGMSRELPYFDNYFDRVFASLMLHHIAGEERTRTLNEVFRVLKPGGEFHIAEFGPPHTALTYLPSLMMRRIEHASDIINGLLPRLLQYAGFSDIAKTANFIAILGTVSLYQAKKCV